MDSHGSDEWSGLTLPFLFRSVNLESKPALGSGSTHVPVPVLSLWLSHFFPGWSLEVGILYFPLQTVSLATVNIPYMKKALYSPSNQPV